HPGRDNRRSLNEADIIHVGLNEQHDRDRHAAEQRREYDDGSDIFLLEVSRQQKLVVVIGTSKKEWSAQGDEKPAHNRRSAGNCLQPPPRRRLWPRPITTAGPLVSS